jgi:hypothetical protein
MTEKPRARCTIGMQEMKAGNRYAGRNKRTVQFFEQSTHC